MPLGAFLAFVFAAVLLIFQFTKSPEIGTPRVEIYGEKNSLGINTINNNQLVWGDQTQVPFLLSSMGATSQDAKITDLNTLAANKEHLGTDFTIKKISDKVTLGIFRAEDKKIIRVLFFADEVLPEEWNNVPIIGDSDFWVMNKSFWPWFLPMPTEGIIYLPDSKPTKALLSKATEHQLPLIRYNQTQGLVVSWEQGEWKVKTRE